MKKLLLLPLLITNISFSQSFVPDAPELNLKSYILIEPNTNTVLLNLIATLKFSLPA
jgi:D-alanyl-D-alanine carboxypeptidase (penicillin-binding protein 5/6)